MAAGTTAGPHGLIASDGTLLEVHDLLLVDLDGVAYLGDRPIEGAAEALTAARDAGLRVVFVTNNASRPPSVVADQLTAMGVAAQPAEVMTSAIAAAAELARRFPAGAPVLIVGGDALRNAVRDAGLRPVERASQDPVVVVQGFAPEVGWLELSEASVALRAGAIWIATNADLTLPSPRGPLPGNGSLIAALAAATGLQPEVIGKPEPALFTAALAAGSGSRPLVIGDRLDTDIGGARAAGLPALLVLSGVSRPADLLAADPQSRPDYIGRDLQALTLVHPQAVAGDGAATGGGSRALLVDGVVTLEDSGAEATPDGLDGLRALCALAWSSDGTWSSDGAWSSDGEPTAYEAALKDLDLD
jgi:glycerol-1-phosphatase